MSVTSKVETKDEPDKSKVIKTVNDFKYFENEDNLLGGENDGVMVFKGVSMGLPIAVKRIDIKITKGWKHIVDEIIAMKNVDKKVFKKKEKYEKGEEENRVLRGIEILRTISHQNIIRIFNFTCDDSYIYVPMELCDMNLYQYCKDRETYQYKFETRLKILKQIGNGLEYLHNHNTCIIHRDLRPKNILVKVYNSHDITAKLSDFGISRVVPKNSEDNSVRTEHKGGLYCSPPEVLILEKKVTKGNDTNQENTAKENTEVEKTEGENITDENIEKENTEGENSEEEITRGTITLEEITVGEKSIRETHKGDISTAVDIYAFGCIIYSLLVKDSPYDKDYYIDDKELDHPFGDLKSEHEFKNNVISGKRKHYLTDEKGPEDKFILADLAVDDATSNDYQNRPDVSTLVRHPLFWKERQKEIFIKGIYDKYLYKIYDKNTKPANIPKFVKDFNNSFGKRFKKNHWAENMHQLRDMIDLDYDIGKKSRNDYDTEYSSLVRLVRNVCEHFSSHKMKFEDLKNEKKEKFQNAANERYKKFQRSANKQMKDFQSNQEKELENFTNESKNTFKMLIKAQEEEFQRFINEQKKKYKDLKFKQDDDLKLTSNKREGIRKVMGNNEVEFLKNVIGSYPYLIYDLFTCYRDELVNIEYKNDFFNEYFEHLIKSECFQRKLNAKKDKSDEEDTNDKNGTIEGTMKNTTDDTTVTNTYELDDGTIEGTTVTNTYELDEDDSSEDEGRVKHGVS